MELRTALKFEKEKTPDHNLEGEHEGLSPCAFDCSKSERKKRDEHWQETPWKTLKDTDRIEMKLSFEMLYDLFFGNASRDDDLSTHGEDAK